MNACSDYEFTYNADSVDREVLIKWLKGNTKKYCFQLEKGDTGYLHFQGKFSLIKKRRKNELLKLFVDLVAPRHLEPLSKEGRDTLYFTKEDTRQEGPWTDKDKEIYIPRQFRDLNLYPYQKTILELTSVFDTRSINVIVDSVGGNGKSTVGCILHLLHNGIRLPPINDSEKLVYTACDMAMARELRDPCFVIDLPRGLEQRKMIQLYVAIEQIKSGQLYDLRNHYREWWIDSPCIWVYTNSDPPFETLTSDRWKLWRITKSKKLKPIDIKNIFS